MNTSCIVFAIFFGLVGATVFFPARKARNQDKIIESWPTAKGTANTSSIQPAATISSGKRGPALYDVVVKYQFRAAGQLHFGETVSFPRRLYKEEEARAVLARYPAGAPITIHYNLENALECYLEFIPSAESRNYTLGILLFVAAGVGLVTAIFTSL